MVAAVDGKEVALRMHLEEMAARSGSSMLPKAKKQLGWEGNASAHAPQAPTSKEDIKQKFLHPEDPCSFTAILHKDYDLRVLNVPNPGPKNKRGWCRSRTSQQRSRWRAERWQGQRQDHRQRQRQGQEQKQRPAEEERQGKGTGKGTGKNKGQGKGKSTGKGKRKGRGKGNKAAATAKEQNNGVCRAGRGSACVWQAVKTDLTQRRTAGSMSGSWRLVGKRCHQHPGPSAPSGRRKAWGNA